VASADLKSGAAVTVSIRPHQIALASDGPTVGAGEPNVFRGTIQRVSYLGDAVDYEVRVESGDVALRVSAPPTLRLRPGANVSLSVPPAACVPLD
ncbi:MAG: TOBE domain-containing protein, partial [Dehalococcoidia bacterium]|nr:TOBE domain-containing protein [Dehalococcoidia bacterium]